MITDGPIVEVEVDEVVKATDRALLVSVDSEEVWIPRSILLDGSDDLDERQSGTLLLPEWFAEREGLA